MSVATVPQRILVVDDNHDSARTMSLLVRKMGYDVETAFDGPEAIEKAAAFRPEVVLLDIGLPTLDGYEAAQRIRELLASRPVTLIALTGWGQEEDRRRALEAGFDHHLTKPADPEILKRLVQGDGAPS